MLTDPDELTNADTLSSLSVVGGTQGAIAAQSSARYWFVGPPEAPPEAVDHVPVRKPSHFSCRCKVDSADYNANKLCRSSKSERAANSSSRGLGAVGDASHCVEPRSKRIERS